MEEIKKLVSTAKSFEKKRRIIEAALFMSPKPLTFVELARLAKCDKTVLDKILEEILFLYSSIDSAIELYASKEFDEYHLRVNKKYLDKVKYLATSSEFGEGVKRTLALIAVKQPIEQSTVIKYRNNKAYEHIKQLTDKGFIEKQPKGKTFVLKTTKKFLTYFGEIKTL